MTSSIRIRRARPDEAAELSEIARAAKRHWGYPERWLERWRAALTLSPEQVAELETYAVLDGPKLVGFYALESSRRGAALEHLWVRPEWMGRGVGKALFRHAAERARALGAEVLEIDSDPNAEAFYRRMGADRVEWVAAPMDGEPDRALPRMRLRLGGEGS